MKFEELNEIQKCRVFSAMEHADNKCLTVKGNLNGQADIVLETENEEKAQVFSLRKYDDEYCVIVTNEDKKLVLDVCGGRNVAGARIIQYPYHGGANQLFRLKEKETGYYVLQSKLGYVVDVEGKNVADGTRIILWRENGGANQKFSLEIEEDGELSSLGDIVQIEDVMSEFFKK